MNQNSDSAVLVTGATGDIGGQLVRALVADGVSVRAMHRRPDQAEALRAVGADPVRASFEDLDALRAAARGCDRMFLLTPPIAGQAEQERRALEVAVEQRLRVVRVSATDSNLRSPVPWAKAHAVLDHRLTATDLDWTVLRASGFMENLIGQAPVIRRGLLPHTSRHGLVPYISTTDIAATAARVLQHDGHTHATYFLTGPEALSMPDIAHQFTQVLKRKVRPLHLPSPVYAAAIRASGQSWFMAKGLRAQYAIVARRSVDIDTTTEVTRLIGRPPISLRSWIEQHADAFER